MSRSSRNTRYVLAAMAMTFVVFGPSMLADSGLNHQVRTQSFGSSGGNVKDSSKRYCCSGTLGSLVTAGGINYILSNNHILARADQAAPGEDISQPGLIDNNCLVPPIVADFTLAPQLGSNVDAAIAQLRPGMMDSGGTILDIGTISSVVKAPSIGLAVAKSGRTTGYTIGTIGSINTAVSVQYQRGCNQGKKFTVTYTNQVVVNGSSFSAGGDSGSLIVTNNSSCRQPVALLFAGNSSTTIGNPIGQVLTKVGQALGSSLSFVGGLCSAATTTSPLKEQILWPSEEAVDYASRVIDGRLDDLMSLPAVIGVGIGAAEEDASEAVIVIYVDTTSQGRPVLPTRIGDVRVKAVFTDPFVAL